MPGGDGTGPMGLGPMTGRAAGYCAGYSVPGYMNPAGGLGRGRALWGRGAGRGLGRWRTFWAAGAGAWPGYAGGWTPALGATAPWTAPSREDEMQMLKDQAGRLEDALQNIRKRIDDLEGTAESK